MAKHLSSQQTRTVRGSSSTKRRTTQRTQGSRNADAQALSGTQTRRRQSSRAQTSSAQTSSQTYTKVNGQEMYVPQGWDPIDSKLAAGGAQDHPHKKRQVGRTIALVLLVVIVLCGIEGFFLYRSAKQVQSQAQTVLTSVQTLTDAAKSGDEQAIKQAASDVNINAHAIKNELSTPLWTIATAVPVLGTDVSNVRTLGDILVDLSDNALSPMASNAEVLNLKNLLSDGVINVEGLQGLATALQTAQPVVERSAQKMDALPASHISKVASTVTKVRDKLDTANTTLTKVNAVLPYLPQMLGANGQTRTYLLVAQNNSELRATGGFPGSVGLINVTDGRITVGNFGTFVGERGVTFEITDEESATFGSAMAISPGNLNSTPNFERAGKLFADAYAAYMGTTVSGTVAVDPGFLQSLLALTGSSVTAADGTVIDGSNAAFELLNNVYWRYGNNNEMADAFFAEVAGKSFQTVMSHMGNAKITDLIKLLNTLGENRRFQVWMADAQEETALKSLGVTGELSDDTTKPVVGIYFNDNTWAKICWYLQVQTSINGATKNADGTTTYNLSTTLTNTITADQAAAAPWYITGYNPDKPDVSAMLETCFFFAPAGGSLSIQGISDMNGTSSPRDISLDGLTGQAVGVWLTAGQSKVISYTVTTPAEATQELTIRTTPLGQQNS